MAALPAVCKHRAPGFIPVTAKLVAAPMRARLPLLPARGLEQLKKTFQLTHALIHALVDNNRSPGTNGTYFGLSRASPTTPIFMGCKGSPKVERRGLLFFCGSSPQGC